MLGMVGHMPVTPAHGWLNQEDNELRTSLEYIGIPCLKINKEHQKAMTKMKSLVPTLPK
jgi:hypothetical protein